MAFTSKDLVGAEFTKVYDPVGFNGAVPVFEFPLGTICRGWDPTYGEGEFIFLQGVASTGVDDFVVYDLKNKTTTRTTTSQKGPGAIAKAAIVANKAGWYQVRGACQVNSTAAAAGAIAYIAATSVLLNTAVAGQGVDGAVFTSAHSGGKADVLLTYPTVGAL